MSAIIKPKHRPVIQKGTSFSYNPETFDKEHSVDNFYVLEDPKELLQMVNPFVINDRHFITFDTETHSCGLKDNEVPPNVIRRWVGKGKKAAPQDFPFCLSICDGTNSYSIFDTLDNKFQKFKALRPLFEDSSIEKIAHNTKFDLHKFANIGMKIKGKLHDTVVLAKLANENRTSFQLMKIAEKLPGGIVKFEYMVDAYKKMHKVADYRMIPIKLLSAYANADVWNCYLEFITDFAVLEKEELLDLYDDEMELMVALWVEERFGMKVDPSYEKPLKEELQQLTDSSEQAIYDEAGTMFNVNSGKQLYEVLLNLGVDRDWIKMSDKGNPKLDKKALSKLAEVHGVTIVQKILEYRKYEKLLSTYATGIYGQRDNAYKVHGSINQTEATTGRMSITKPALQTLPKKDQRIRSAFIPSDDYELWFMDLDQIEYRLFAHYSKAQTMIEAIKKGWDVHRATAATVYGVDYEDVTDDQRQKAKTLNFSLIYGQGDSATAASLGLPIGEARRFKRQYFAQIPEAEPFIQMVQKVTRTRGYIRNYYQRRRRLTSSETYKAPNALIQGCAADYIKHKKVLIYKFLVAGGYKTRMINIVHDEIIFEVHKDEKFLLPKLRWLLSDFEEFRVPITAGIEYGAPSWGEKQEAEGIGFEPVDASELELINNHNVFDGSAFALFGVV